MKTKGEPTPHHIDSRICLAIAYFTREGDALRYALTVGKRGDRYNGGFFDGMACGREPGRDYTDTDTGVRYYAVSTR